MLVTPCESHLGTKPHMLCVSCVCVCVRMCHLRGETTCCVMLFLEHTQLWSLQTELQNTYPSMDDSQSCKEQESLFGSLKVCSNHLILKKERKNKMYKKM
jgi:hypothetical protein